MRWVKLFTAGLFVKVSAVKIDSCFKLIKENKEKANFNLFQLSKYLGKLGSVPPLRRPCQVSLRLTFLFKLPHEETHRTSVGSAASTTGPQAARLEIHPDNKKWIPYFQFCVFMAGQIRHGRFTQEDGSHGWFTTFYCFKSTRRFERPQRSHKVSATRWNENSAGQPSTHMCCHLWRSI